MEAAPPTVPLPESGSGQSPDKSLEKSSAKKRKRRGEAVVSWAAERQERKPDVEQSSDKPKRMPFEFGESKADDAKPEKKTYESLIEKFAEKRDSNPEDDAAAGQESESVAEKGEPKDPEIIDAEEQEVIEPELVKLNREVDANPPDAAVERFRDLIVVEGKPSDEAFEEVMGELGVDEEEIAELGAETPEMEATEAPVMPETVMFARDAETAEPVAEDEPDDVTAAPASPAGPGGTVPPASPGPGGAGGGGGHGPAGPGGPGGPVPPHGPRFGMPHGPYGPGGPGVPYGPGGAGAGFNVMPLAPVMAPNMPPRPEYIEDRANPAAMALFGGIIGYLIGRRRGRIKTEKKLLPIQKKLEKQVEDMQWQIREKEDKIRRTAAEKVKQRGPAVIEAIAAKNAVTKQEKPISRLESAAYERRRAPEANQLHGKPSPELIGHMLMAAEMPTAISGARSAEATKAIERQNEIGKIRGEQLTARRVETLNRSELLELSEKIMVEGSSLRQIYETHLIGERGLRRLIGEHLRGGDLKKALRQEIVEREIDFERDPVLRDMKPADDNGHGGSAGAGGKATLDRMVAEASKALPANEEAAFYKARAKYEAKQYEEKQKDSQLINISMATVIMVLLGAVIYLFITRS